MLAILAEKPSAMRNMTKAFGGLAGNYNGEEFELCAARGHLYEFKDPENQVSADKKTKYHSWLVSNMPWDPKDFKWAYTKKDNVDDTLEAIAETFAKCDEIVIATDDDPSGEGTLLAAEIIINLGYDKNRKISRMFFADESAKELQKAFKNRKRFNSIYDDPDYVKALYRAKWDFMSMQFTRVATKLGDGKSVLRQGRLKSAMVLLVGDQLAKVAAYKKTPYYQYRFKDENDNIFVYEDEQKYPDKNSVPKNKYNNSDVITEEKQRKYSAPPKLIDLASLSARLSTKGFKAKEVLDTYQKMYEAQIVSYPRTEDKAITIEQFNELLPLCDSIARVIGVNPALLVHKEPRAGFVKEGMAHGANRPGVNVPASLDDLATYGKCAKDIYSILAASYLAMLCADFEYDAQDAYLKSYPDFKSHITIPVSAGWKAVYNDESDSDSDSDVNNAGFGTTALPFVYEGFPPKPQVPTMKWLMKQLDKANVGTGATRTSTYAEVTNEKSKYPLMKDTKGKISMSQFGDMSYRLLPGTHIGTLEITTHVFDDMAAIAKGQKDPDICLEEIAQFVIDDIKAMTTNGENMRKELNIMAQEEQAERFEGTWNGEDVHPKRVWSGHRFTDDEIEKLLNGEEITIDAVSSDGKPYRCKGKLAKQEYNGNEFIGFSRTAFVNDGPNSWCKYTFTADEKADLLAGKTVKGTKFIGKSGKTFKAIVKWNAKDEKIEVVEFVK